eukprot:CAMPEP_0196719728 /NCGR_PEP_ID=MMETSP1091-20130531/2669_1 /TAXON_ID=302021 /ORGANISM="Rhodomonas sp., Strain CCMP768" /LENGTH=39 /DNA_ID= /DNA_START= /DNA_END= /DNA_ORIENTATION=
MAPKLTMLDEEYFCDGMVHVDGVPTWCDHGPGTGNNGGK